MTTTEINLTIFNEFILPRNVVASNIQVSIDNSNIYLNALSATATNIGPGVPVYSGAPGGVLNFKTFTSGQNIDISTDGTTITIASTNLVIGATNIGGLTNGLFLQNAAGILQFRTLIAGSYIVMTQTGSNIVVSAASDIDITATNIGPVGQGIFANDTGHILEFKKIAPGSNIGITTDGTTVFISATNIFTAATNIGGDTNALFVSSAGGVLQFRTLIAGSYINMTQTTTTIFVSVSGSSGVTGATNIGSTGVGAFNINNGGILEFERFIGGANVDISSNGTAITIMATNIVTGAANLGIPTFGLFTANVGGQLQFKSLQAGSNILLTTTTTGVMINSTASTVVAGATNIGGLTCGLFFQNNAGILEFKTLIAGSNIALAQTNSQVTVNAVGTGDAALFGVCSGIGNNASLVRFIRFDGSPSTTNPYSPALANKSATITGFSAALHDLVSTITISATQTMFFTIGRVLSGAAPIAANFTAYAGAPHMSWTNADNNTWVNKSVTGLSFSVAQGDRVYVASQGAASVSQNIFALDWSLWYRSI